MNLVVGFGFGANLISLFASRMVADLFETYAVTSLAAMLLGSLVVKTYENAIFYPLMLGTLRSLHLLYSSSL